jgi:hypothetical protein
MRGSWLTRLLALQEAAAAEGPQLRRSTRERKKPKLLDPSSIKKDLPLFCGTQNMWDALLHVTELDS